jgi:hypothetical protein
LINQKWSAYWRKVETEDLRRHINAEKKHLKEAVKHQEEFTAEVARLTALSTTTTDNTEKRQIKINLKINETNLSDVKVYITDQTAFITELET